MLKLFSGLSPLGGALVFSALYFGIFLRIYNLDLISHWSDELASLYFAKNLNLIFSEETHPPGFYLFIRLMSSLFGESIYTLRSVIAILSSSLSVYLMLYSRRIFNLNGWIIFCIFLFLLPVDIAFSRSLRMYSPLFGISLWFYLVQIKEPENSLKLSTLSFLMSWIFPLGFLPGLSLLFYEVASAKKWQRLSYALCFSLLPIFIYYGLRILTQTKSQFLSDYLGEGEKQRSLFIDFFYTFAGDHFPKFPFLREASSTWIIFLAVAMAILVASLMLSSRITILRKHWSYHGQLILISLFFVEVFSTFVTNIRLGRYLIFLMPIIPIHGALLSGMVKDRFRLIGGSLLFLLISFQLLIYKPFEFYPWEREAFLSFQKLKLLRGEEKFVLCGNKFQYAFYLNSPHKHCMHEYEKLKSTKADFIFMDLNGFMRKALYEIGQDYVLSDLQIIGSSTVAWAKYRGPLFNSSRSVTKPSSLAKINSGDIYGSLKR